MSSQYKRQFVPGMGTIKDPILGITFDFGLTVPTGAGYAPGCMFLDIDAAAGAQFYINEGTLAAASFVAMPSLAELNRNNKVSTRLVTVAISTAITVALHEGRTCLLTGTGAAFTQTLPAATGTGNKFRFVVGAVNTSNHVIITTGADVMLGNITSNSVAASPDLCSIWIATTATTCTLNGTTTGGAQIGDWLEFEDILSAKWAVRGCTTSTTAAIPFS